MGIFFCKTTKNLPKYWLLILKSSAHKRVKL